MPARTDPVRAPTLTERVLAGDRRALAQAVTVLESGSRDGPNLMREVFARSGRAWIVGVTGAPGVGKSTLVGGLVSAWRQAGRTVAVLAVDPTSPFTGGAILGDRIRLQAHAVDQGVFVRSMATRGHVGGLAFATADAVDLLDAAGMDVVVVETVGVGQGEVDVARTAHVSVVVTVPGTGDDVQAIKAGIMEIGDIFVVNKADREGADRAAAEITAALALRGEERDGTCPPVHKTVASTGAGIASLVAALDDFRSRHAPDAAARRRAWASARVHETLVRRVVDSARSRPALKAAMGTAIDRVARREADPYTVVDEMLEKVR